MRAKFWRAVSELAGGDAGVYFSNCVGVDFGVVVEGELACARLLLVECGAAARCARTGSVLMIAGEDSSTVAAERHLR